MPFAVLLVGLSFNGGDEKKTRGCVHVSTFGSNDALGDGPFCRALREGLRSGSKYDEQNANELEHWNWSPSFSAVIRACASRRLGCALSRLRFADRRYSYQPTGLPLSCSSSQASS